MLHPDPCFPAIIVNECSIVENDSIALALVLEHINIYLLCHMAVDKQGQADSVRWNAIFGHNMQYILCAQGLKNTFAYFTQAVRSV